jgi:4-hydroxy-3-methylbut-2-enyl diphosphate reductase
MATVTLAEHAGFCFGVRRAVAMANELADKGGACAMLGPIIHNPQVVAGLLAKGMRLIHSPEEALPGEKVLIRSHGVSCGVYAILAARGTQAVDATCPDVRRSHAIVLGASSQGKLVLMAGDEAHPEVAGILSNCKGECHCFAGAGELSCFLNSSRFDSTKPAILLAQTTFPYEEWQKCGEIVRNVYTNINIFDTICKATKLRQDAAGRLAAQSGAMVVVGGRQSSNTAKLAAICREICPTVVIETAGELRPRFFHGTNCIGLTAGASTPAYIIQEVQRRMSDMVTKPEEMSFEEMLDQSFKTVRNQQKVTGVVTNVSANEIAVDIGTKHAGYVPLYEFTDDPNAKLDELVKVGDEIELLVLRLNDVEGTAMLSKKRVDAIAGFDAIIAAEESGEVMDGIVVDVVKGGVIALTRGVRVFIPASQATMSRGQELESLLRKPVQFKILEVNRGRRRAVGSIRSVLRDQRKGLEDQFWQTAEVGKTYQGTVKSLTSYGAFVDIGGVDGMVHISELSWSRIKHPSEVVNVGDVVEVYIRDMDTEGENKKISLGYKKTEDNPWEVLARTYNAGDAVDAKVVSMTPFGAFAQVIPGVDGLIHISQISSEHVAKPSDALVIGQTVKVAITEIDYDKKRVSLSIRALLPETQPESDNMADGAVVAEAGPEGAVISPDLQDGE